jgi:hypothetical protein
VSERKWKHRWTGAEDKILRSHWGAMSLARISVFTKRSEGAIYWRARQLGLDLGVPRGMESFIDAARRVGMDVATLDHAIRWYTRSRGGEVERRKTPALRKRQKGAHQALDPFDVDLVVEAWTKSETVRDAARRLELVDTTLRRWMMEAGHVPPPSGQHWRMMPEEFDAVALPLIAKTEAEAKARKERRAVAAVRRAARLERAKEREAKQSAIAARKAARLRLAEARGKKARPRRVPGSGRVDTVAGTLDGSGVDVDGKGAGESVPNHGKPVAKPRRHR